MEQFTEKAASLRTMLEGCRRAAILTHTNPDGDAVGSSLAWAHALQAHGIAADVIVPTRCPSFLGWMDGISEVIVQKDSPEAAAQAVAQADVLFCLDLNNLDRMDAISESIAANTRAPRVLIDHHLSPEPQFDLMFSYPYECSTSYLVFCLIEALYGTDSVSMGDIESLYAGIMTDTGNLSFSYLTPGLFSAISVMLARGLSIQKVNTAVYSSYSPHRMRLMGYALYCKMNVIESGSVAYIDLDEDEMRHFSFQLGDSEGFVNLPLSISGVRMSALFTQNRDFIRISLRSRGDSVDVNQFARRYFSGGGHRNAAGGRSYSSMEETIRLFRKAAHEFLAECVPSAPVI